MGSAISKSNKDYINDNWDQLKCSPIGPFLQMLGIAPGNATETSNLCKSSAFSAQFNSSMTEHVNMTGKLTEGLSSISSTMDNFRKVIASMEQSAFNDLSQIATQIFKIYVKLGNIFYVMVKNLINICIFYFFACARHTTHITKHKNIPIHIPIVAPSLICSFLL